MPKQAQPDPVLHHLVHAVNEAQTASIPCSLSVHGHVMFGELISQATYFAALTGGGQLLAALDPASDLAPDDYAHDAARADEDYLHLRLPAESAGQALPVWRIQMASVDAWSVPLADTAGEHAHTSPSITA